jgi:putative acetyltransferase
MHITRESPNQPDVLALIEALDAYQTSLYPAESNHLLDLNALPPSSVLFVVARDAPDGPAIACGAVVLMGDYGEVKRMYVQSAQRGRGIGKAIMAAIETEALRVNCPYLRLETGIHQHEAIALYERSGFTRCGRYGDYPNDPLSVFMEKRIAV